MRVLILIASVLSTFFLNTVCANPSLFKAVREGNEGLVEKILSEALAESKEKIELAEIKLAEDIIARRAHTVSIVEGDGEVEEKEKEKEKEEEDSVMGIDITKTDEDGYSALHYAASLGHKSIVRLLLALDDGTAVNAKNNQGETALMLAAESGNLHICMLLLGANANKELKDFQGKRAVEYTSNEDVKRLFALSPRCGTGNDGGIPVKGDGGGDDEDDEDEKKKHARVAPQVVTQQHSKEEDKNEVNNKGQEHKQEQETKTTYSKVPSSLRAMLGTLAFLGLFHFLREQPVRQIP